MIKKIINGLIGTYMAASVIGCATVPTMEQRRNAELEALLNEPVGEMSFKREDLSKKSKKTSKYNNSIASLNLIGYVAPKKETPPENISNFLIPREESIIPVEEDLNLEDLYNSCREDLRTERAINSDIRCEYFKDDKHGTCDVSIQGDKYSVRMPTEDLKLGKTSGAYWKVINQNPKLLDSLAKQYCTPKEFDFTEEN